MSMTKMHACFHAMVTLVLDCSAMDAVHAPHCGCYLVSPHNAVSLSYRADWIVADSSDMPARCDTVLCALNKDTQSQIGQDRLLVDVVDRHHLHHHHHHHACC
jgi:hypothetical protein